jgi:pyridoxal phosphate enzyme (YggS family)
VIAENLAKVRAAIAEAAVAAGRDPTSVRLVGVSKLQPVEAASEAVAAGLPDLGENYAQELRDKARVVRGATWHFIGPLQRNKVKYVVGVASLIHSIDSPSLLEEVARRAATLGIVQKILIQVNVAGELQKSGCSVEELPSLTDSARALPSLAVEGLMLIPPAGDPEATRPHFQKLAALAVEERARTSLALRELSMGMSADYAVAIACGATLVRVGTAIFGERKG